VRFVCKEDILPVIKDCLVLVPLAVFRPRAEVCGRYLLLYICLLIALISICVSLKPYLKRALLNR
jgi:hypothetical protein